MANKPRRVRGISAGLYMIIATAYAAGPNVAFPFNSQVPLVARVGRPYNFQFSESTFAPDSAAYTYSLSDQPAWLSVDSATRTLSGMPSETDVGAPVFTLTAASSAGVAHMQCTMVVSKDPPPQIEGNIGEQLAATVNLSSSEPLVVTVLASSSFHFQFQPDSFIDIVRRKLYYYATLSDHTPLPSWLMFDSQSLEFSGTTPPALTAQPQSWTISLIASDVAGFSGTAASFTITTGAQDLVFVPQHQYVHITPGMPANFSGLQDTLFRNGAKLVPADLKIAKASVPGWLKFEPTTLNFTGTAPANVQDLNVTVTVRDRFGDQAVALLYLVTAKSTLITGTIGTLTAHATQEFSYHFPGSLFINQDVNLQIDLPANAKWLRFDTSTRTLSGKAPIQSRASLIQCTVTAKLPNSSESQSQTFTIRLLPPSPTTRTSSVSVHGGATTTPAGALGTNKAHTHLNSGVVAAVVLGCLLAAAILAACLALLRRRRMKQSYVESSSPGRRTISRPMLQTEDGITVTTELQRDVENSAGAAAQGRDTADTERAPQIALDLPAHEHGKRFKWSKRFSRLSHTSSLGQGEDAVKADGNIPEWGVDAAMIHDPHESFSVPTEIARSSNQLADLSPSKRALKRLRRPRKSSIPSVGLGIDTTGSALVPRYSARGRRDHIRATSSMNASATIGGSSIASFSTRGTSVLSARPSDFPRPPTRSTFGDSRSTYATSRLEGAKNKSIRLVERSDSVADGRSIQAKRQSFIKRQRASSSFDQSLFANGPRVPPDVKQNGRMSVGGSSRVGHLRSQRGTSQLTTYSESSSLEPPPRDPRRLSVGERIRTAFAPNFPRAITQPTLDTNADANTENAKSYQMCTVVKPTLNAGDERDQAGDTSSFYTTSSEINEKDYTAEMALPRHERTWVLPGEASPTPPPMVSSSARKHRKADGSARFKAGRPRERGKEPEREHSDSPLSTAVAVPLVDRDFLAASTRASQVRRSGLSEPMSLISNDSLSKPKQERPRLVQAHSRRPVSVERIQRLSSLRAESSDTRPGSEMFEALEEAGLMPTSGSEIKMASQKSNFSGAAFL